MNPFQANHHANRRCQLSIMQGCVYLEIEQNRRSARVLDLPRRGRTENGIAIVVDIERHAYVIRETLSSDFPTLNPCQSAQMGLRMSSSQSSTMTGTFLYSTFLGSSEQNRGHAIAVDAKGHAYVIGRITVPRTGVFFSTGRGTSQFFIGHLDLISLSQVRLLPLLL